MTPAVSTFYAKHLDRTGGGKDSDPRRALAVAAAARRSHVSSVSHP
jgi:hypothetical protein